MNKVCKLHLDKQIFCKEKSCSTLRFTGIAIDSKMAKPLGSGSNQHVHLNTVLQSLGFMLIKANVSTTF